MTAIAYPRSRRAGTSRRRSIDLRKMEPEQLWQLAEQLQGRPVPGVRMTEAEFLDWCDEDVRAEWVDGEIVVMAPANFEHEDINSWLTTLLRMFVEEHDLGIVCTNVNARLPNQKRLRVPDLFIVVKDRQHLMRSTYFDGAPDAVIEIVSPDSQSRDRREKYEEYEKAGVREYWIIDPLSKTVELYQLDRKRFRRVIETDDFLVSSVVHGLRLKPSMLWRKPLPKVASVLRQLRSAH